MNGGYIMIKASDADIYLEASRALTIGKPILFYENDTTCYYIDTITLDGTNIVLTKGGKTITIANDNTITTSGDILTIMENIVDSQGNKRFIEFDGVITDAEGVDITFTKLSLSGTHLMAVVAGTIANGSALNMSEGHRIIVTFNDIPKWVLDKMIGVSSQYPSIIDAKTITAYSDDFSTNQTFRCTIQKNGSLGTIQITQQSTLTASADRIFRIQVDLLIDADYSE